MKDELCHSEPLPARAAKNLLLWLKVAALAALVVCGFILADLLWEAQALGHESRAVVGQIKATLPETMTGLNRATAALEAAAKEAGARAMELKAATDELNAAAKNTRIGTGELAVTARRINDELLPPLVSAAQRGDSLLAYAQETLPGTVAELDAILQRIGAASDQWAQSSIEHKKSSVELTAAIAALRQILDDPATRALPEDVHRLLVQAEKAARAGKLSLATSIIVAIAGAVAGALH